MKPTIVAIALFITLLTAVEASAQEAQDLAPLRKAEETEARNIELYKDPLIATYLSATVPGLGQFYTGHKKRGFMFFVGIVGSLGAAAAFYEPAELKLADYDSPDFGGNGDGLLSTSEVENWDDGDFEDEAFERLSTRRKAGAITGLVTGVGLYIWNVIDARRSAHEHNRQLAQRRIDLGLLCGPDRAGVALNLHF